MELDNDAVEIGILDNEFDLEFTDAEKRVEPCDQELSAMDVDEEEEGSGNDNGPKQNETLESEQQGGKTEQDNLHKDSRHRRRNGRSKNKGMHL